MPVVFPCESWKEYTTLEDLFPESDSVSKVEHDDFCSLSDIPDLNNPDLIFQNISPLRNIEEPAASSYTVTSPNPSELLSLDNVSEFFLATTAHAADSMLMPYITAPADEIQPEKEHISPRDKRTNKERQIFKCEQQGCDYKTFRNSDLQSHMKTHSEDATPCSQPDCLFKTTHHVAMNKHMQKHRDSGSPPKPKKLYSCSHPFCDYTSENTGNIQRHMKTHGEDATPCNQSGCLFKTTYHLVMIKHIETYHRDIFGELTILLTCEVQGCDYTTVRKHDLSRHMLTHGDEATFFCSQSDCQFRSTMKTALIKHFDKYHREIPAAPEPTAKRQRTRRS